MSTPTGSGPSDGKDLDRRKSLGKYVKRMSSVFKREKSSKSSASSSSTPAPAPAPAAPSVPAPPAVVEEKKESTTAAPTPSSAPSAPAAATTTTSPAPQSAGAQQLNRSAMQQERARALFAKYGLTLESHEWISTAAQPISVQRVEKPIRMRVHRSCHHCGTTYGADKVCSKCEHRRCKKCPRYPKKKTATADKGKEMEFAAAEAPTKKKKKMLTMTNKHGDERVYQRVQQRVKRSCHKCHTYFNPPTATVCENETCRHIRCTKCPREPAKLDKWPNGYPGDAEPESETEVERDLTAVRRIWRKPRTRVRWECEECHSLFIEGSYQCPSCGHGRCEKCTRHPLKRNKKEREFDPDIIRAVEEKLKALVVDDPQTTSLAAA